MTSQVSSGVPLTDSLWEGVFASFREANGDSQTFDGDRWLASLAQRFELQLGSARGPASIPEAAKARDSLLPVLIASTASRLPKPLTLLDFGGGVAQTYLETRAALPAGIDLSWHVVERTSVCEVGQRLCDHLAEVHFHESIASFLATGEKPSIVHVGSALHYLEDWRGCLAELVSSGPEYLSLTDVPAGDVPTFVTLQRYYDKRIPVWIWNLQDFEDVISALGYTIRYRVRYAASVAGNDGGWPMKALPLDHRISHPCNLLFCRASDRA